MRIGFITTLTYAAALTLVACRNEAPPPVETTAPAAAPAPAEPADARNADVDITLPLIADAVGRCEPSKTTYAKGETVQLTIDLNQAPQGLTVGARILDAKGKVLFYASRPGTGQKSVTIPVEGSFAAGKYKLQGYWGGNLVCEHDITVGK